MKTKLIVIGVVSAVALTGLWFVALWRPQTKSLDTAKIERATAQKDLDTLRNRLTRLKQLEANAAVLERDKALLSAALPDTDQLDQFILQVNEKASASGVSFVSVAPTEPTADRPAASSSSAGAQAGPISIGLQLQVAGDYHSIMRFLETLRDGERLVTVENLQMTKPTDGTMTAAIKGKMFVNRPPTATTARPQTTAKPAETESVPR